MALLADLTGLMAPLAGSWQAAGQVHAVPGGAGAMALAVLTLTAVLIALLAQNARVAAVVTAGPLTGRSVGLREKSWLAAFQRLLDPAAPGRPLPRAPSAAPAAA